MNLRIIKAGVMDTIQDAGRFGWQHLGVNPGGAMDLMAAGIANVLVGNAPGEAVVEMHFPASAFFFEKPALIAIGGADFGPTLNGEEIPRLRPILVSKYSILQFQRPESGARAYLAIHGGLAIEPWLQSRSTNLKAAIGGYKGRVLQKDDEIGLRWEKDLSSLIGKKEFAVMSWKAEQDWEDPYGDKILILAGHEWERLGEKSQKKIFHQAFVITSQSDRMGYRLSSRLLGDAPGEEVVSSAVTFGTIQLLPGGQLIILMADHQTAGGYPRVAHVISAHRSKLAQLRPGDSIHFQMTDQQTAEELLMKQQKHLVQLQNACLFKIEELLHAIH